MTGAAAYNRNERWWYVAAVRWQAEKGCFAVMFERVLSDGRFERVGQEFFREARDAEVRCKKAVRVKVKRKGFVLVDREKLPKGVLARLERSMEATPSELMVILAEARAERYVVLRDVTGMEDSFDVGVQYMGRETREPEFLEVMDRFGQVKVVFKERVLSVELTEEAMEARKIGM